MVSYKVVQVTASSLKGNMVSRTALSIPEDAQEFGYRNYGDGIVYQLVGITDGVDTLLERIERNGRQPDIPYADVDEKTLLLLRISDVLCVEDGRIFAKQHPSKEEIKPFKHLVAQLYSKPQLG